MPDLGIKHECLECGAKFYDLGKPDPVCPRCGASQKRLVVDEKPPETAPPVAPEEIEETELETEDDEVLEELHDEEDDLVEEDLLDDED